MNKKMKNPLCSKIFWDSCRSNDKLSNQLSSLISISKFSKKCSLKAYCFYSSWNCVYQDASSQSSDDCWPQNCCLLYLTQLCQPQASYIQLHVESLPTVSRSLTCLIPSSWHTCSIAFYKITACCISLLNCADPELLTYNLMQNYYLLYLTP